MTLEDQVILGGEAEKVIKNPAYTYALTVMKGKALADLQSVSMLDTDKIFRDELIRKLQVVSEFEGEVQNIMEDGQFAHNVLNSNQK